MKCKNCWILKNKLSNLEEHNWKLKKKLEKLKQKIDMKLITKTDVQKAINKINDYCKKNNLHIKTNINGLIRELVGG